MADDLDLDNAKFSSAQGQAAWIAITTVIKTLAESNEVNIVKIYRALEEEIEKAKAAAPSEVQQKSAIPYLEELRTNIKEAYQRGGYISSIDDAPD